MNSTLELAKAALARLAESPDVEAMLRDGGYLKDSYPRSSRDCPMALYLSAACGISVGVTHDYIRVGPPWKGEMIDPIPVPVFEFIRKFDERNLV